MKFEELQRSTSWLHLVSLTESANRRLTVIVSPSANLKPRAVVGKHVDELMKAPVEREPVEHYELSWTDYLYFSSRDESHAGGVSSDVFQGGPIRRFSKSWLLDHLEQLVVSDEILPAKPQHFGVYCVDHIVDVLAYEAPKVRSLGKLES